MTSSFNKAQTLTTMQPQSPSARLQRVSSHTLRPSSPQIPDPGPKSTSSGFLTSVTPVTSSTSNPSTSLVPPEKLSSPPAAPGPLPKTSESLSSFVEAKQVRQTKARKVGGGIFHASGHSTIFPTGTGMEKDGPPSTPQSRSTSLDTAGSKLSSSASASELVAAPANLSLNEAALIEAPMTLFDLVRTWRSMLTSTERWKLFQVCRVSFFFELTLIWYLPTDHTPLNYSLFMQHFARTPFTQFNTRGFLGSSDLSPDQRRRS